MFGQYGAFIFPSYLVSALVIVGLFVWIRQQYNANTATIENLEKSGLRRRSQKAD